MQNKYRAMLHTLAIVVAAGVFAWVVHMMFLWLSQSDLALAIAGLACTWWIYMVYKVNLAYLIITDVLEKERDELKS